MTTFELIIVCWLIGLTFGVMVFKRGRRGKEGKEGEKGSFNQYDISSWAIQRASIELLDEPEYITKLIQKLNALQLSSGDKVGK